MTFNRIIDWIKTKGITPATKKFDVDEKQNADYSKNNVLRSWDPFEDTLSAAIMSGLEIIPINNSTNLLYIGKINGHTALNFLDLVEDKQKNFFLDKDSNSKNLELTNLQNINNLEQIKGKLFSIVYINDNTIPINDVINISEEFLNEIGYLIVVLSRSSKEKFDDSFNKLSKYFQIIQEVNIENYFRDTTLIVYSTKKIISKFN